MYEEENVVVEEEVFEDETLVCKECGNEFVSPQVKSSSTRKKAL